jgi:hypothetical protein
MQLLLSHIMIAAWFAWALVWMLLLDIVMVVMLKQYLQQSLLPSASVIAAIFVLLWEARQGKAIPSSFLASNLINVEEIPAPVNPIVVNPIVVNPIIVNPIIFNPIIVKPLLSIPLQPVGVNPIAGGVHNNQHCTWVSTYILRYICLVREMSTFPASVP